MAALNEFDLIYDMISNDKILNFKIGVAGHGNKKTLLPPKFENQNTFSKSDFRFCLLLPRILLRAIFEEKISDGSK